MNASVRARATALATLTRWPWLSLSLGAAAVAVYALPLLPAALEYNRPALAAGQSWRIVTCHWTHWSGEHLFWDVLMFVAMGAVCERISRVRMAAALLATAIIIPAVVYAFSPRMTAYRGLSGLDSALFVLAAVRIVHDSIVRGSRVRTILGICCLAAFPAKILLELLTGSAIFVQDASGMVPVPLAHVIGATVGALVGCLHLQPATNVAAEATS